MGIYVIFTKGNLCPAFQAEQERTESSSVSAASQLLSTQSNPSTRVVYLEWPIPMHFIDHYNVFSIIIIRKHKLKPQLDATTKLLIWLKLKEKKKLNILYQMLEWVPYIAGGYLR